MGLLFTTQTTASFSIFKSQSKRSVIGQFFVAKPAIIDCTKQSPVKGGDGLVPTLMSVPGENWLAAPLVCSQWQLITVNSMSLHVFGRENRTLP